MCKKIFGLKNFASNWWVSINAGSNGQTEECTEEQTDGQTDIQTDRQTDWHL